ncbi:MAG: hypothetical protein CSA29_01765 [Desulfobacterales bacterium]|nr:MAG: hypothetical protein CSA29_01765 [Desulfobacterales bacterium]
MECGHVSNYTALKDALEFDIHACTDITGFGILGHLMEMAIGDAKRITVDFDTRPFYPHAHAMYAKGESTGANTNNQAMVSNYDLQVKRHLTHENHSI